MHVYDRCAVEGQRLADLAANIVSELDRHGVNAKRRCPCGKVRIDQIRAALDLGLAHSIQPATFDRAADIRCLIETANEEEGN